MEAEKIFFNYTIVVNAFNKLINLLSEDEKHIKNDNINKIYDSLEERTDLINFLARQKDTLAKCSDKRAILTDQQAGVLNELSRNLHDIACRSKREISKAMYANERILSFVASIISNEVKNVSYNRKGLNKNTSKFREVPHIALNKKL